MLHRDSVTLSRQRGGERRHLAFQRATTQRRTPGGGHRGPTVCSLCLRLCGLRHSELRQVRQAGPRKRHGMKHESIRNDKNTTTNNRRGVGRRGFVAVLTLSKELATPPSSRRASSRACASWSPWPLPAPSRGASTLAAATAAARCPTAPPRSPLRLPLPAPPAPGTPSALPRAPRSAGNRSRRWPRTQPGAATTS